MAVLGGLGTAILSHNHSYFQTSLSGKHQPKLLKHQTKLLKSQRRVFLTLNRKLPASCGKLVERTLDLTKCRPPSVAGALVASHQGQRAICGNQEHLRRIPSRFINSSTPFRCQFVTLFALKCPIQLPATSGDRPEKSPQRIQRMFPAPFASTGDPLSMTSLPSSLCLSPVLHCSQLQPANVADGRLGARLNLI